MLEKPKEPVKKLKRVDPEYLKRQRAIVVSKKSLVRNITDFKARIFSQEFSRLRPKDNSSFFKSMFVPQGVLIKLSATVCSEVYKKYARLTKSNALPTAMFEIMIAIKLAEIFKDPSENNLKNLYFRLANP